jgi:hypothetical protein
VSKPSRQVAIKEIDWGFCRIDWGYRRRLVGNGPGHLLFCSNQVLELNAGISPELKRVLKGYNVVNDQGIDPLANHLARIYGGETFSGLPDSKNFVLDEISQIRETGNLKQRDKLIRDFDRRLRAAWQMRHRQRAEFDSHFVEDVERKRWFVKNGKLVGVVDFDYGDMGGSGSLISYRFQEYTKLANDLGCAPSYDDLRRRIEPISFEVRTTEESVFARVAFKLNRIPTKKDLRDELCRDTSAIAKLCKESGFSWLPAAQKSRSKKAADQLW